MRLRHPLTKPTLDLIARTTHEVNRVYCSGLGDRSQVPWEQAPVWQRDSARAGVRAIVSGETKSSEDQHASWMALKAEEGWVYGPRKDADKKTHPCMVPYHELPEHQRMKDQLFRAVVLGMLSHMEMTE